MNAVEEVPIFHRWRVLILKRDKLRFKDQGVMNMEKVLLRHCETYDLEQIKAILGGGIVNPNQKPTSSQSAHPLNPLDISSPNAITSKQIRPTLVGRYVVAHYEDVGNYTYLTELGLLQRGAEGGTFV